MQPKPSCRIATRNSRLALWQAHFVRDCLERQQLAVKLVERITKGDQILDRPLQEIGGKGLFIKELELALLNREADIAVHSLKDLPVVLNPEFHLCAVMERHSPNDVIVLRPDAPIAKTFPRDGDAIELLRTTPLTLATSSLRRASQLRSFNKSHRIAPIRGNIDTRLQKLRDSDWDGILLAEASLDRLGLKDSLNFAVLDSQWFTPSAAQGALGIETLRSYNMPAAVAQLNHPETNFLVSLERRALALLGGDCHLPFACFARKQGDNLLLTTKVFNASGESAHSELREPWPGVVSDVESLAMKAVRHLVAQGAQTIFQDLGLSIPATTLKQL